MWGIVKLISFEKVGVINSRSKILFINVMRIELKFYSLALTFKIGGKLIEFLKSFSVDNRLMEVKVSWQRIGIHAAVISYLRIYSLTYSAIMAKPYGILYMP